MPRCLRNINFEKAMEMEREFQLGLCMSRHSASRNLYVSRLFVSILSGHEQREG